MNIYRLKTAIFSTGLITLMTVGTANAFEISEGEVSHTYLDPITGEVKEAQKLLSEMSDTEKALLSNDEYLALKELEAKLDAEKLAPAELDSEE